MYRYFLHTSKLQDFAIIYDDFYTFLFNKYLSLTFLLWS